MEAGGMVCVGDMKYWREEHEVRHGHVGLIGGNDWTEDT